MNHRFSHNSLGNILFEAIRIDKYDAYLKWQL